MLGHAPIGEKGYQSALDHAHDLPLEPEAIERPRSSGKMTVHEARRVRRAVESNLKAIENRIRFFQREEEKIWRDLDEVRRQAATMEEGRARALEKRLTSRSIAQARDFTEQQNRNKATFQKQANMQVRERTEQKQLQARQVAAEQQRQFSQDVLRQKRMTETETKLTNSERAVAVQRAKLEASLKANTEKAHRLERMRAEREAERAAAEQDVLYAEAKLPDLEAEEILCLQRLQNSRIVTQSVLEELGASLGSRTSVAAIMRAKDSPPDMEGG